jgi:hypothetical protein
MVSPDIALALLINRAAQAYASGAPAYITYQERTHVIGGNRTQDINRSVAVRVSDNFAVMQDLPNGGERTGQAFPIIPYFDPISTFQFSYFANLKRIDINLDRGKTFEIPVPQSDPGVDVTVPYMSFWAPRYASDSTADAPHITIDPTPRTGDNTFYPSDVVEDPQTHLPSHIEMRVTGGDMEISLDYKVIDGHWVVTHGTWGGTQRVAFMTFRVQADVTYDNFTFPQTPPDPRLAEGVPTPTAPAATETPQRP